MFAVSRRSFLEKLSLGVGSLLLAPIAESLISQAHGQGLAASELCSAWWALAFIGI